MKYFKNFDEVFRTTYLALSNNDLGDEDLLKLRNNCEQLLRGFDMDIIVRLFRIHITNSSQMITPTCLQAYIMCLQDAGEIAPLQ